MTAQPSAERAELLKRAAARLELDRRKALTPLAFAKLWHRDDFDTSGPTLRKRTSQREAALPWADPATFILIALGGNRAGKSDMLAQFAVATAAGRDAWVLDPVRKCRVYYVREWLKLNELPDETIAPESGDVWVGSPTWGSALQQVRPKIAKLVPKGSELRGWMNEGPGEIRLPNGDGVLLGKAYRQYVQEPQTWEGAAVRGVFLDEEPASQENISAAVSRTADFKAKIMIAVTILSGKGGWFNRQYVVPHNPEVVKRYIYGIDNPHVGTEELERIYRNVPKWQRASRMFGVATSPEGAIWPIDQAVHVLPPFVPPPAWVRWQGWDWGSRSPHVVWLAESPGEYSVGTRTLRKGDLVAYREYAPRRETTDPGISDRALIEEALRLERELEPEGATVSFRVADSESPGAIAEAASLGLWLMPAAKGPGSVNEGLHLVEALLSTTDGVTLQEQMPRLYFTEDCPRLLEEACGLRWATVKEGATEKPDPACPDHGPDTVRYVCQLRQAMGIR